MHRADSCAKVIGHLKVISVKVKQCDVKDVNDKLVAMSRVKRM